MILPRRKWSQTCAFHNLNSLVHREGPRQTGCGPPWSNPAAHMATLSRVIPSDVSGPDVSGHELDLEHAAIVFKG